MPLRRRGPLHGLLMLGGLLALGRLLVLHLHHLLALGRLLHLLGAHRLGLLRAGGLHLLHRLHPAGLSRLGLGLLRLGTGLGLYLSPRLTLGLGLGLPRRLLLARHGLALLEGRRPGGACSRRILDWLPRLRRAEGGLGRRCGPRRGGAGGRSARLLRQGVPREWAGIQGSARPHARLRNRRTRQGPRQGSDPCRDRAAVRDRRGCARREAGPAGERRR
ncbi:hypothetical protein, partial [Methylobacterium dankookense]|uniref:hypothetical protein n=1 Tax=Methylobacterium dankookense TaxID=560405 RepID=UPI0011A3281F